MPQKHVLRCDCGQSLEIEASQAGQEISCKCGLTQKVPTLMKIRELPLVETPSSKPDLVKRETGQMRRAFFWLGAIVLVPSVIFLLWTVFLTKPLPKHVSLKQTDFTFGQMLLKQDSTPIPEYEHTILWMRDEYIDHMAPMELYFYFLYFKNGPNFSYNFQENYQALKDIWHIRMATGGFLIFLGLLSLVSSFFMPKRDVVVTGWSGTEWE